MPESDNDHIQPLAEIDKLIHEPARLMILATLRVVESADFLSMQRQTGLTRGNLSSHMSDLEDAGYIEITKEFVEKIPRTLLRVTDKGRSALLEYKIEMNKVLDGLDES